MHQRRQKGECAGGRQYFKKVLEQQPRSLLAHSVPAFPAEVFLCEGLSSTHRLIVINRHKTMAAESLQSDNAQRGERRIAGLDLQQAWSQEAQSMYERAMVHNRHQPDGHREVLGFGCAFLAIKKWTDAGKAITRIGQ